MLEAIGNILQQVVGSAYQATLIRGIPFDKPLILTQQDNHLVVHIHTLSIKSLECILYASEKECTRSEKVLFQSGVPTMFHFVEVQINSIIEWRLLDKASLYLTTSYAIKTLDYNKLFESRL